MIIKKNTNPLSDIRISHEMIIQGDPTSTATLTCGLRITGIAMENSSNLYKSHVEDSLRSLLQSLPSEYSIQMRFTNSGDYTAELETYYETTMAHANRWSKEQRNFKYGLIHDYTNHGLISRKEVHLFISRKTSGHEHKAKTTNLEQLDTLLKAEASLFETVIAQIKHAMQLVGGNAKQLDDKELFFEYDKALNPSIKYYDEDSAVERFHSGGSISQCCLHSDMVASEEVDCGFFFDGIYHAVLVLKSLPSISSSGQITQLSNLQIKDYSITLLTNQLDLENELTKEEKKSVTLERMLSSSHKIRMKAGLQKSRDRIDRLAAGDAAPFSLQMILHCWDKNLTTLQNTKVNIIKSAILRFQRAQYYCVNNSVMARNFYFSTLPGSPVQELAFTHQTEDVTVANLLPISSNHDKSLANAEAIYQTANNGLFAISLFKNENGKPFTNHGIITGKTGYGKSSTTIDLLTQIQPHIDTMYIIEDGNSYGGYVSTFGDQASSCFIDSNGSDTLNYLDTGGNPASARHRADVSNVLKLMIDKEGQHLVSKSRISGLVYRFYLDYFNHWRGKHSEVYKMACLEFAAATRYFASIQKKNSLISNQYAGFQEWQRLNPADYEKILVRAAEDIVDPSNEDFFQFCFAFITPEQSPTHSMFYDWVCNESKINPSQWLETLQCNLLNWCAGQGENGCLFDGVSTIRFDSPIVHIELGKISEGQSLLKSIAAFIVSNYIRNAITLMPRNKRKLVVFEELGRFLTFDNAEHIVADFYARGRKFNTCVLSVVQEISQIKSDALRNSILSNSSFAMLFRQEDTGNAKALQNAFKLPEATTLELSTLPAPSRETGSQFICWQASDNGSVIHRGCNIVSNEMLYIVDSSGDHYEMRQRELAQHEDVIEGIRIESNKNTQQSFTRA